MKKLEQLAAIGQSVWYDYIRRTFLEGGGLQRLIDEGVRGVTSNPAIFDKAIAGSKDYDEQITTLVAAGKSVAEIYEALVIADIRVAADQMRPVYERTEKMDGFVSLEVSPDLADNTGKTIADAQRLFEAVSRANLMIKVPATEAGIPAVQDLIAGGINVNVTLLFGVDNYRQVAEAFLDGLERLAERGPTVAGGHPRLGSVNIEDISTASIEAYIGSVTGLGYTVVIAYYCRAGFHVPDDNVGVLHAPAWIKPNRNPAGGRGANDHLQVLIYNSPAQRHLRCHDL